MNSQQRNRNGREMKGIICECQCSEMNVKRVTWTMEGMGVRGQEWANE